MFETEPRSRENGATRRHGGNRSRGEDRVYREGGVADARHSLRLVTSRELEDSEGLP